MLESQWRRTFHIPVGMRRIPLSLSSVFVLATPVSAAQEYHVDLTATNVVRFLSKAPLEEFEGVTDRIDGYVLLDSETLRETPSGGTTEMYFEVDLTSLDTGIGLRNRHMRDNYLEVAEYPYATYAGTIDEVTATAPGQFRVNSLGTMAIHGREQPLSVACDVSELGDGYSITCSFQILLSDFAIKIPKVMFLKVADEVRIELDFAVQPAGGQE